MAHMLHFRLPDVAQEHFSCVSSVSSDPQPAGFFWERGLGTDGSYLWPLSSQKVTVLVFSALSSNLKHPSV